jgi:hypothetical protein
MSITLHTMIEKTTTDVIGLQVGATIVDEFVQYIEQRTISTTEFESLLVPLMSDMERTNWELFHRARIYR